LKTFRPEAARRGLSAKEDQSSKKIPMPLQILCAAEKKRLSRGGRLVHAGCEIRVKNDPTQPGVPGRLPATGRIFREAVLVAVLSAALAFAANQISPRGLALTRDYFPTGTAHSVRPVAAAGLPRVGGTNSGTLSPAQFLAAQLMEKGLQSMDGRQAAQFFHDPRFQQDIIVFVDARDEEHYQQGHIPGAYEFDPYHPEKYFDTVLPLCQKAEQIAVYCNGGDCDDSESAAILLRDAGIPNQKLFVYGGGFAEWTTNSLPVETGARNSGNLRNLNQ
jgi:rhodanese-related sulfurtransferase